MLKKTHDYVLSLVINADGKKAIAIGGENPISNLTDAISLYQQARKSGFKKYTQNCGLTFLKEGVCRCLLAVYDEDPIKNLYYGIELQQRARKEGLPPNTRPYASSFFNEGIAYTTLAQYNENPIENYGRTIEYMSKARMNGYEENTPDFGRTFFNESLSLIALAKLGKDPKENIHRAVKLLEKARLKGFDKDSTDFALTFLHEGIAYTTLAELGENPIDNLNLAILTQQKARKLGLLKESSNFGLSLINEGIAYSDLASYKDPEGNYNRAIELQVQARNDGLEKNTPQWAGSLKSEGYFRFLLAELGFDPIFNLQTAINLQIRAREEGFKQGTEDFASTYTNQGIAHSTLATLGINPIENFYKSIEFQQTARSIGLIESTPPFTHTYINEGYARQGLAYYGELPLENLKKTIELEQKARIGLLENTVDYASTLLNEGNAWEDLSNYVDQPKVALNNAIKKYREARERGFIKGTRYYGLTLVNEGYSRKSLADHGEEVINNLEVTLQLIQEARTDGLVLNSTDYGISCAFEGNIRRLLADQGVDPINNKSTAILRCQEALTIFRKTNSKIDEASILQVFADIKRRSGEISDAYGLLKESIAILETIRKNIRIPDFRKNSYEKMISIYHDMVFTCVLLEKFEDAFHYAESAKGRTFLDLLAADKKKIRGNAELVDGYSELLTKINELESFIEKIENNGISEVPYDKLADKQAQLRLYYTQYQTLIHQIKISDPEYYSIATVEPVSIADVKKIIRGNTLIEYFLTEKLFVFILNNDLNVIELEISDKELIKKVKELKILISLLESANSANPPNFEELKKKDSMAMILLKELYQILIKPIKPFLSENLIIIPHSILHYIPFQALFDDKFLIDEYTIKFAQSASSLLYQKEGMASNVLVVGNPNDDLEDAQSEARVVAKALHVKPILIDDATKERIISEISNKGVLHFACHAKYNHNFPMFSGVILKDFQKISAYEFMNLNLHAELTVLSACESAIGTISPGDEIEGLIRAIQYGGSHYVIGSLWNVDDSATSQLFQFFYKNPGTPVERLRNSILNHKKNATISSFYYWAPFQIYGL